MPYSALHSVQTALFLHVASPPAQFSVSTFVHPAVIHLRVCVPLPFDFHSSYICSASAAVTTSPHSHITGVVQSPSSVPLCFVFVVVTVQPSFSHTFQ